MTVAANTGNQEGRPALSTSRMCEVDLQPVRDACNDTMALQDFRDLVRQCIVAGMRVCVVNPVELPDQQGKLRPGDWGTVTDVAGDIAVDWDCVPGRNLMLWENFKAFKAVEFELVKPQGMCRVAF